MRITTALVVGLIVISTVGAPATAGAPAPADDGTGVPSAAATAPGVTDQRSESTDVARSATDPPADPDNDTLGWEGGYWHNESIDVTPGNGYNRTEIDRIVTRSMARVERIRELEFDERPNVTFVTREEFAAIFPEYNVSTEQRLHQNTKFEAMFMVREDDSYFADLEGNRGGATAAFHVNQDIPGTNLSEGDIGIIVDEKSANVQPFSESTLGHELLHFVQNNEFNLSRYSGGTTEEDAAVNTALVEGDATLVGLMYDQRCEDQWDCLPSGDQSTPQLANVGLVLYDLAPYSETATLFDAVKQEGGWEAVNDLYEDPPVSMEQYLHPEKYPDDTPTNVTVEHKTAEDWRVLDLPNSSIDYATFGEAGVFLMLYYPSFQGRSTVVIPRNAPFDTTEEFVRYNYTSRYSEGWDGDKLYPYVNDSSAETNETGYVWKMVWDSDRDAEEFLGAYERVLDHFGAEQVGERTYVLDENTGYGDAFHLRQDGNVTMIVNAPTVDALSDVRTDVEVQPLDTTTTTTTASPTTTTRTGSGSTTTTAEDPTGATTTTSDGSDATTTTTPETTDGGGVPGFGIGVAVLALLAGGLLATRRYRR